LPRNGERSHKIWVQHRGLVTIEADPRCPEEPCASPRIDRQSIPFERERSADEVVRVVSSVSRFPAVLFFALVAFGLARPIFEIDFFWHLASGHWIWEHTSLPTEDPFSYTAGTPDARDSFVLRGFWIAQLIYALLWRLTGPVGIVLLRVGILTGAAYVVYRILRAKDIHPSWAMLGVVPFLADVQLRMFLGDRPQHWTFLLVVFLIVLLESLRSRERIQPEARTVALPVLMLAWANLHGGFFLGDVIIGLYGVGVTIEAALRRRDVSAALPFVALGAISILASLVNPTGFDVIWTLWAYRQAYYSSVVEMKPVFELIAAGWIPLGYLVTLALVGATLVFRLRRLAIYHLLVLVFLLGISLARARFAILFVLVAVPLCLPYWKDRLAGLLTSVGVGRALAGGAVLVAGLMAGEAVSLGHVLNRDPIDESTYPRGAVDYLKKARPEGNIFNPYEWGGYLMTYLPEYPVFIDGRGMRANDQRMAVEYESLLAASSFVVGGKAEWQSILDKFQVTIVLTQKRDQFVGREVPLVRALGDASQWTRVYDDSLSVVFVRAPASIPPAPVVKQTAQPASERHAVVPPEVARTWKAVVLEISDRKDARKRDITVDIGESITVGSIEITVEYFLPSFAMTEATITSASNRLDNPAVGLRVVEGGVTVFAGAIFSRFPAIHPVQHERYEIRLKDFVKR
jgi:hypothetical protein